MGELIFQILPDKFRQKKNSGMTKPCRSSENEHIFVFLSRDFFEDALIGISIFFLLILFSGQL